MKRLFRFLIVSALCQLSLTAFAQYAPLQWNETGVAIRQGWHIEWMRAGESDADGNVVYAWSDTRVGDRDVYAQKVSPSGTRLWGEGGVLVVSHEGRQEDPSLIPTGFGDYIVIWNDFRDDTAKGDLYAQKLDENGVRQWDPDGVLLSTGDFDSPAVFRIVADGTGGAIILWNDLRNGDVGDIYAIRVLADGTVPAPWPENGMEVTVEPAGQRQLTVDTDGAGGAIIGWKDSQVRPSGSDIFIQRVTVDGDLAWNNGDPLPVCQADGDQESPKLCPDGSGGVYIVWEDKRDDSNGDLYFHHILSDGSKPFPEVNGKVLINDPGVNRRQEKPRIVADGYGNAIILWQDTRNDPLTNDIYVQKVDADGNLLWNITGEPVCENPAGQIQSRLNADGTGGAVAVWMDERDGNETPKNNIFAQKINADGSMAWTTDGIPVCEAPGYQFAPLVRAFSTYSLIAWGDERTGSQGIWYQLLDSDGNALLETDGDTLVWGISNNAEGVKLLQDGLGNIFVFFQDLRESSAGYQAYVQVLDTLGQVQLAADGIPICPDPEFTADKSQEYIDACTDGDHGAIAVWEDHRDSNPSSKQIYAQRVGSDGTLYWGDAGVQVSPYDNQQTQPQVVSDGEGGGIVVWSELTPFYDNRINAARIDHDGNTLWSVEVADNAYQDDILQTIAPDGEGGVYICFYNLNPFEPGNFNLYARRLDGAGNLVWGDTTLVICDAPDKQLNCKSLSLGEDGVVFVWEDSRGGADIDLYAQRVSLDGETLWDANGIVVCAEAQDQSYADLSTDGSGHIYVTWEDFRNSNDMDMYVQKLDLNGQLLYAPEGLPVSTAERYQNRGKILNDGADGNYIVWVDYRSGSFSDIYGTHLTADGQLSTETVPGWSDSWVADGNIINDAYHLQLKPKAIGDYSGGAIVVWEDKRSSGKEEVINIYAQRLNGSVVGVHNQGEPATRPADFVLYKPFPNPFNPTVTVRYDLRRSGFVRLSVFDLAGREIAVLAQERQNAGRHEITWKAQGVASGIYFIRLQSDRRTSLQKAILIR